MKKYIFLLILVLSTMMVFSESVVMVFPQEDDTIIIFDDHSWFYHSEISWYDSVEFIHYDEDNQFAILEEKSYISKDDKIIISGVAMNTSRSSKGCEIAYAVLDSNRTILLSGSAETEGKIAPGNLFPFTIEFNNVENAKYISFDYVMEVE